MAVYLYLWRRWGIKVAIKCLNRSSNVLGHLFIYMGGKLYVWKTLLSDLYDFTVI